MEMEMEKSRGTRTELSDTDIEEEKVEQPVR